MSRTMRHLLSFIILAAVALAASPSTIMANAHDLPRQDTDVSLVDDPCLRFMEDEDEVDDHHLDEDHDVDHAHDDDDHVHEWEIAEGDPIAISEIPFDLLFIDTMIPHHDSAVLMAEIAVARSTRAEIVELSQGIIAQQEAEIDQLRAWRAEWYPQADPVPVAFQVALMDEGMMVAGIPADAGMGMGDDHLDVEADARALCAAPDPAAFDQEFIDRMIRHHQSAIGMSQIAIARAENEPLLPFAQAIVDLQTQEIAILADWHSSWFGVSSPDATPGA